MGCFNSIGFHTNQDIYCGQRCVGFICVSYKANGKHYNIPISLPVFGKYNDYGSLENIERTHTVEEIEKVFDVGVGIDEIVDIIMQMSDYGGNGRYSQVSDIVKSINAGRESYYTMDNYFMKHEYEIYTKIRDYAFNIVTKYNCSSIVDPSRIDAINDRIEELRKDNQNSKEILDLERLKKFYDSEIEYRKDNFDVYFCFDHACLWDVCSPKVYSGAYKRISNENLKYCDKGYDYHTVYNWKNNLREVVIGEYSYNDSSKKYVYALHDFENPDNETELEKALWFSLNLNYTLKFKPTVYSGQDINRGMYRKLNMELKKTYKEY